jgi:hypothetical protein
MQIDQLNEIIEAEVKKRLAQSGNGNVAEPKYGLIAITNLWSHNKGSYKATLKNHYKDRLNELVEHIVGFQLFPNTIEGRGDYVLYAMVPHSVKADFDAKIAALRKNHE